MKILRRRPRPEQGVRVLPVRFSDDLAADMLAGWKDANIEAIRLAPRSDGTFDLVARAARDEMLIMPDVARVLFHANDLLNAVETAVEDDEDVPLPVLRAALRFRDVYEQAG